MNSLCKALKNVKSINLTLNEIQVQGIENAKIYLIKLCGFTINETDDSFLRGTNAVRKGIAHANGELYDVNSKIVVKIEKFVKRELSCSIKYYTGDDEKNTTRNKNNVGIIEYCLEQANNVIKNLYKQLK